MWAESAELKPAPARGCGIKDSSCCSEKCWFLEAPVLLSSVTPKAAVVRSSPSYQSRKGKIKLWSHVCLLPAEMCLVAWLCSYSLVKSTAKDVLIGLVYTF